MSLSSRKQVPPPLGSLPLASFPPLPFAFAALAASPSVAALAASAAAAWSSAVGASSVVAFLTSTVDYFASTSVPAASLAAEPPPQAVSSAKQATLAIEVKKFFVFI